MSNLRSPDAPRPVRPERGRTVSEVRIPIDAWFDRSTLGAGVWVLVLLTLVGVFLLLRSLEALRVTGPSFLTSGSWVIQGNPPDFGVLALLAGTLQVALVAVALAIPFGVCAALFISEYASPRGRRYLTALVDLLAAVPSLLFGIWGYTTLTDQVVPVEEWLARYLGRIPFLAVEPGARLTGTIFIAGIVVGLMTVPIVASVSREVFAQTPPAEKEAALALGSTRWGMIRAVVLPYGRGGVIGGSMLGLGRALGETIAVALVLPQVSVIQSHILENGGATISGFIAVRVGGDPFEASALLGCGLVLFVLTLATNMVASVIVSRSRSGVGVEI